ncbi:DoxX family protein [Mycobacterium sp. NPDC050853]|uniref:DoxX family protein n=1 Tax=Mycobacterium sp. NPDC050853 TaxID=3155160 RepID=UPI0033C26C35
MRRWPVELWKMLTRVSIGYMFVSGAVGKIANLGRFRDDFAAWGAPLPSISAPVTAWVELIAGVMLIVGLLTWMAALALSAIMAGAIWLSVVPGLAGQSTAEFFSNFFYSPEWLLLLVLGAVAWVGAGTLSCDNRLRHANLLVAGHKWNFADPRGLSSAVGA